MTKEEQLITEQRKRLVNLAEKAMEVYDRALTPGEDVSIAAEKIATNVLRTLGLIGDRVQHEVKVTEEVQFIAIGTNENGEIVKLDSASSAPSEVPKA